MMAYALNRHYYLGPPLASIGDIVRLSSLDPFQLFVPTKGLIGREE
jgi:hypothetical protein